MVIMVSSSVSTIFIFSLKASEGADNLIWLSKDMQRSFMDVTKSPQWAWMADRGWLRPATIVSTEYLENPFPETGTEIHAPPVPSCPRLPSPCCLLLLCHALGLQNWFPCLRKIQGQNVKYFSVFSTKARRNPGIILFFPECNRLLIKNRRAVSLFWLIPSHGQVFLPGFEYLLQALRLKIVYTLWTLPYLKDQT